MDAYNVKPAVIDLHVYSGNSIDFDLNVTLPGGDEPLSECSLHMKIRKSDGTLYRYLESSGENPGLVVAGDTLSIHTDPINEVSTFWFDILKVASETVKKTFITGKIIVTHSQTIV